MNLLGANGLLNRVIGRLKLFHDLTGRNKRLTAGVISWGDVGTNRPDPLRGVISFPHDQIRQRDLGLVCRVLFFSFGRHTVLRPRKGTFAGKTHMGSERLKDFGSSPRAPRRHTVGPRRFLIISLVNLIRGSTRLIFIELSHHRGLL